MEYPQTAEAYSAKMAQAHYAACQTGGEALSGAIAATGMVGGDSGHIARSVSGLQQISETMAIALSAFESNLGRLMGGHPMPQPTEGPGLAGELTPARPCDVEMLDIVIKQLFARVDHLSGLVNRLREL